MRNSIADRASNIAFNLIIALPPSIIFLLNIVAMIPVLSQRFNKLLFSLLSDISPSSSIQVFLNDIFTDLLVRPRNTLLSFGFVLAIVFSSNAVLGIINSFNRTKLETQFDRNYFHQRWIAIKITFFLIINFLVLTTLQYFINGGMADLLDFINVMDLSQRRLIYFYTRLIVYLAMVFSSIAIIYRYGPSVQKKWGIISPGAILSTIILLLTIYGFGFYLNNFSTYNKIYGPLGTVLALFFLIYLISFILLIGFEFNVVFFALVKRKKLR